MKEKKIKIVIINPEQLEAARKAFTKMMFESYKENSKDDKAE